jgi:hypothetical protein
MGGGNYFVWEIYKEQRTGRKKDVCFLEGGKKPKKKCFLKTNFLEDVA